MMIQKYRKSNSNQANSSTATLRIGGDDLQPDKITEFLGCKPTKSQTKGQIFSSKKSGKERAAKTGMWRFSVADATPANLDAQIVEIFQQLPSDMTKWEQLSSRYDIDLFCVLFLNKTNDVILIAPEPMKILSSRGVTLTLDMYASKPDDE